MIWTDFPISACADKNRWAWYYERTDVRYAKCTLHKNARGKVHTVNMKKSWRDLYIRLSGTTDRVQQKNPRSHSGYLYEDTGLCDSRGKDWYNDTRLLASRCIHAMMKKKDALDALYRLHGVRPSYKKRTGKNG